MKAELTAAGASLLGAFAVLALCAFSASAAPAPPRSGERITLTACPYPGTEATCLMLNGADGTVYNITGASPKPRLIGRMIRLRGAVTDKLSACNQGIILDRIRWTRSRQKCPN
jgi:hypothetical protein